MSLERSTFRKLAPGQFFRNTDTGGCLRRIRQATKDDVAELEAAFDSERNKSRRSKLMRALVARIHVLKGAS